MHVKVINHEPKTGYSFDIDLSSSQILIIALHYRMSYFDITQKLHQPISNDEYLNIAKILKTR
jgi:hypothetical protein